MLTKLLNYKQQPFSYQNASKLTYSNLGFQNFPGGKTPGPPFTGGG